MEKHKFLGKFVIAPCSGVGQTVGTISRQAAYVIVDEIMPNETLLLCLPAFVTGVEEDVKMVEENPDRIIAIEGCGHKCMSKILEGKGYKPAETIIISQIIRETGLRIDRTKSRARLGAEEERIVLEVVKRVIEVIKELKSKS